MNYRLDLAPKGEDIRRTVCHDGSPFERCAPNLRFAATVARDAGCSARVPAPASLTSEAERQVAIGESILEHLKRAAFARDLPFFTAAEKVSRGDEVARLRHEFSRLTPEQRDAAYMESMTAAASCAIHITDRMWREDVILPKTMLCFAGRQCYPHEVRVYVEQFISRQEGLGFGDAASWLRYGLYGLGAVAALAVVRAALRWAA